jgi:hypothetical protein
MPLWGLHYLTMKPCQKVTSRFSVIYALERPIKLAVTARIYFWNAMTKSVDLTGSLDGNHAGEGQIEKINNSNAFNAGNALGHSFLMSRVSNSVQHAASAPAPVAVTNSASTSILPAGEGT